MKKIQYILSALILAVLVVSCNQDLEIGKGQGYLSLQITSLTSTHTPEGTRAAAPEDYAPKNLHVEIRDAAGAVVKSTDDFASDQAFQENIRLTVGSYTIIAHSANWDGNGSGFDAPYYYGSTTIDIQSGTLVKASVTCTQANVKLTVNYEPSFVRSFSSAIATVTSTLADIAPLQFVMNETTASGYIPVGNFDMKLDVVNKKGMSYSLARSFTDVQARDHYILNIKLAEEGYLGDAVNGGIKVEVDESTNTYTFTLLLPEKSSISLATKDANAWSTFACLSGSIMSKSSDFDNARLTFQWKEQSDADWNTMPSSELTVDGSDNVTATLRGLTPNTKYECRLCYVEDENVIAGNTINFTTESMTPLYNGGFEYWNQQGKPWYANEAGKSYWDSSNTGSTYLSADDNVTTRTESPVVSGQYAAKLESKLINALIMTKFAAASLYTGTFGDLVGTSGAKLNWGVPFTERPTALKGWMQYAPVAIDNKGSDLPEGAPAKGEMDQCGIYLALLDLPDENNNGPSDEFLVVNNTDMSTFPKWETDSRVIAYGTLGDDESGSSNGQWKEVNIPLVYRDLNRKPTHLLVVFSSSKYGDYFHGGTGSTLYLDDFSFEYGEPTLK